MKLEQNRKHQLRESLWRDKQSPNKVEKLKLLKQKTSLKTLEKDEREFMAELKFKIGNRFDRLQKSYE